MREAAAVEEWIQVGSLAIVDYDGWTMVMARTYLASDAARVERMVVFLRGQGVILDSDLARLYEVPTRALVQAVNRHVSAHGGRVQGSEVTGCDLKHRHWQGRPSL